jgi:hypothetical protein
MDNNDSNIWLAMMEMISIYTYHITKIIRWNWTYQNNEIIIGMIMAYTSKFHQF